MKLPEVSRQAIDQTFKDSLQKHRRQGETTDKEKQNHFAG
jgi:hypothetical protein